jgi:hypothetical protein
MIAAAAIAVKWWLQIATVSSKAPNIFHFNDAPCSPIGTGQQNRRDQRKKRERDVVGVGDARRERQHGDEMGGPDAEAGRGRGDAEPDRSHPAFGNAHVMQ